MTDKYALVNKSSGIVENVIMWDGKVWDGTEGYTVPQGYEAVYLDENQSVSPGYSYTKGIFTAPEVKIPEKSDEEKQADNVSTKQLLIDQATQKIVVWQTKLLIGRKLTADETTALNEWLDYIDTLEATDAETPDEIDWPEQPA